MKKLYALIRLMVVLALITTINLEGNAMNAQAITLTDEERENLKDETAVVGKLKLSVVADASVNFVENDHEGTIYGDGVRLRLKPSKTSTVLELMNNGEEVLVYPQITAESGKGKWTYIKRYKTGTTGWVSNDYIIVL